MRVILLDDEKAALDELTYYLKKYESLEIVAAYTEPMKLLDELKTIKFDAAFLDIDMPVVNGLNVAMELLAYNNHLNIIFVTVHDEYAVKAFELNAIDYVMKPILKDRLDKAVEKLMKADIKNISMKKVILDRLNRIAKSMKQDSERIAAFDDEEINLLKMSDVLFFEAELGKTVIVTQPGRYKTKETLDQLENKLCDYGFYRCHRSYLVNLRYVNKISPMFNNNYVIKQEGNPFDIPVSRNNIKELRKVLGIQ